MEIRARPIYHHPICYTYRRSTQKFPYKLRDSAATKTLKNVHCTFFVPHVLLLSTQAQMAQPEHKLTDLPPRVCLQADRAMAPGLDVQQGQRQSKALRNPPLQICGGLAFVLYSTFRYGGLP